MKTKFNKLGLPPVVFSFLLHLIFGKTLSFHFTTFNTKFSFRDNH